MGYGGSGGLLVPEGSPASPVTDACTSLYVTGDSLSDDGNLLGPIWDFATGGSPYQGSFLRGGTFTNGYVWDAPLLEACDDAGRDGRNVAVSRAETSGGGLVAPTSAARSRGSSTPPRAGPAARTRSPRSGSAATRSSARRPPGTASARRARRPIAWPRAPAASPRTGSTTS